jgi:hypothetical protein
MNVNNNTKSIIVKHPTFEFLKKDKLIFFNNHNF